MFCTNGGFAWLAHIQKCPAMPNKFPAMLACIVIKVGIVWPGVQRNNAFYDFIGI